jgi:hypothetical protein
MPNPNRPQYQDTIEETWGQAVADTVVRRYANTADRDADFEGRPGAELIGQLVAITPPGGRAYLEEYVNETYGWTPLPSIVAKEIGVTLDTWGNWVDQLPPGAVLVSATANAAQESNQLLMVRHLTLAPTGGNLVGFRSWWSNSPTNPANTTIIVAYLAAVTY